MELLLVQHGEAKTEAEDPVRPLAERGADAVRSMAVWAARAGVKVDQIRHSGKRRAEQTAAILADRLTPAQGVIVVSGLGPNDDVGTIAETIQGEQQFPMLVGHLPFLSRLTGLLVTGDASTSVVAFRNAGIVCLTDKEGTWSIKWAMTPDLAN